MMSTAAATGQQGNPGGCVSGVCTVTRGLCPASLCCAPGVVSLCLVMACLSSTHLIVSFLVCCRHETAPRSMQQCSPQRQATQPSSACLGRHCRLASYQSCIGEQPHTGVSSFRCRPDAIGCGLGNKGWGRFFGHLSSSAVIA
jgi:hypothetical protein